MVNGLVFCNRVLGFVNAPALMQHVVQGLQDASVDVDQYVRKRDLLYNSLVEMGFSIVKPMGAFYMFPKSPMIPTLPAYFPPPSRCHASL